MREREGVCVCVSISGLFLGKEKKVSERRATKRFMEFN
jgi:hypothetical protein